MKTNQKSSTRTRVHQPIEVFSRLHYAGEMNEKVNDITTSEAPTLDGLPVPETQKEYSKRRFKVYRRVVSEAWESASQEVKDEVLAIVEKEREDVAEKKREEDKDEDDEDGDEEERSAESYLE